mgnify:CR=1 FL=1
MNAFSRTDKQREATAILAGSEEAGLFGGSRSGKTFIIIRSIIIRACKTKSRHLIARLHFNHVKTSIWYDTLPKVLETCFPDLKVEMNKSDWFIKFPNGSEIWLGGVDDKERVEKILGTEFSTIYINETSQVSYDAVTMLQTRLAENSGLELRMWYDFNPPSKKHWTYLYFVLGISPEDLKPLAEKIPYLIMNPGDNLQNLPPSYLKRLARLPKRQRDRFLDGKFTLDTEGALWTYDQIIDARARDIAIVNRTVVAVDPAVTNNPDSDECGIIVASSENKAMEDVDGELVDAFRIDADYSGKFSTQTWALRAINAYNHHDADAIVAEVNQGGDLVEDVLRLNGFKGRVIKIHAKKGKALRAEPIVALYEQDRVAHADDLDDLESEMMEWVPMNTKDSPNRIDAAVYAIAELAGEGDNLGDLLEMAIGSMR